LGQTLLRNTPESHYETMPLSLESQDTVFVATARLDNRDELCAALAIPVAEQATLPDGQLILRAYQKWGEECPHHLLGDWSLAIWHPRERRLFLARDQFGGTGLLYYHRASFFAFASGSDALLALPEIPRHLDEMHFARYLAIVPGDLDHTIWDNVRLLLPGHALTVTADGMRVRRYWDLEDVRDIRLCSESDYIEGFLDHYRRAVRSRLRTVRPVGTTLSSGLDSGSVTTLAAEALRARGERLTAFTSVPLHAAEHLVHGATADEWPLAHAVAERWDNIEHVPIRAQAHSPLAAVKRGLRLWDQPLHGATNMFWVLDLYAAAQTRGLGVLLTGHMGNGGISWSGGRNRIFYLFMNGQWNAGRQALAEWHTYHKRSWLNAVRSQLLWPVLGSFWQQRNRLLRPGMPSWTGIGALTPAFARRTHLRAAARQSHLHALFARPLTPKQERVLMMTVNSAAAGPLEHAAGATFGLELRDPTADVRLLEYCFGLPNELYANQGRERLLVRQAMDGLLPPAVQWNTRRGRQAADVALRLLDHRAEMDAVLAHIAVSPIVTEYVDVGALQTAWVALQKHVTPQTTGQAMLLLMRGVMGGLFLESLNR
jgi:asparagine synthase (glutamine-hydrolysing)